MMVNIFDVAKYIVEQEEGITPLKLQGLCYYSYVWSLVWDEDVLFNSDFCASENGAINERLREATKWRFRLHSRLLEGDSSKLTKTNKETIDQVIKHFKDRTGYYLSQLIKSEEPYKKALKAENINYGILSSDIYGYYAFLEINKRDQIKNKECKDEEKLNKEIINTMKEMIEVLNLYPKSLEDVLPDKIIVRCL